MKPFFFILILIIAIILFFLWQYVFSIYEVFYKTEPEHLYTSADSVIKLEAVPLNALGFRAPFRNAPFTYEWESGRQLVEIVEDRHEQGYLVLRSAGSEGTVVIKIKGRYTLLPSLIEIRILANLTELKTGDLP